MATVTPNYGMTLPAYTDRVDINVLNNNFSTCDTQIKAAQTAAASAASAAAAAQSSADSGISEINETITEMSDDFDSRIDAVERKTGMEILTAYSHCVARECFVTFDGASGEGNLWYPSGVTSPPTFIMLTQSAYQEPVLTVILSNDYNNEHKYARLKAKVAGGTYAIGNVGYNVLFFW